MLAGQMSIYDFVESDKPAPKLKVGQRAYKLTLDVVTTGKITNIREITDGYCYETKEDITFFSEYEIGNAVFTDREQAYKKASELSKKYEVIRKEEMKVLKEDNFIENCKDKRILISATVKLLKGNMVYFSKWYTYHFLEKLEDEKSAIKKYEELLEKIKSELNDSRFKVNAPVELKDMYLCKDGTWSEYRYVSHNRPVIKEGSHGKKKQKLQKKYG